MSESSIDLKIGEVVTELQRINSQVSILTEQLEVAKRLVTDGKPQKIGFRHANFLDCLTMLAGKRKADLICDFLNFTENNEGNTRIVVSVPYSFSPKVHIELSKPYLDIICGVLDVNNVPPQNPVIVSELDLNSSNHNQLDFSTGVSLLSIKEMFKQAKGTMTRHAFFRAVELCPERDSILEEATVAFKRRHNGWLYKGQKTILDSVNSASRLIELKEVNVSLASEWLGDLTKLSLLFQDPISDLIDEKVIKVYECARQAVEEKVNDPTAGTVLESIDEILHPKPTI